MVKKISNGIKKIHFSSDHVKRFSKHDHPVGLFAFAGPIGEFDNMLGLGSHLFKAAANRIQALVDPVSRVLEKG